MSEIERFPQDPPFGYPPIEEKFIKDSGDGDLGGFELPNGGEYPPKPPDSATLAARLKEVLGGSGVAGERFPYERYESLEYDPRFAGKIPIREVDPGAALKRLFDGGWTPLPKFTGGGAAGSEPQPDASAGGVQEAPSQTEEGTK